MRGIQRMTGAHKATINAFINDVGVLCGDLMDTKFRNLDCADVQVDELWTIIGKRQRNVGRKDSPAIGNAYVWIAMDHNSRLVFCWHVGGRGSTDARPFLTDLSSRLAGPVRVVSDAYSVYRKNMHDLFPHGLEYYTRVKGAGTAKLWKIGRDESSVMVNAASVGVHTNYVERHNGTMREHLRRLQRGTKGFTKKRANLCMALNVYMFYYNFILMHGSLNTTPAMAAGVERRPWTIEALLGAFECREQENSKNRDTSREILGAIGDTEFDEMLARAWQKLGMEMTA